MKLKIARLLLTIWIVMAGGVSSMSAWWWYDSETPLGEMPEEWAELNPKNCTDIGIVYYRDRWYNDVDVPAFISVIANNAPENIVVANYVDVRGQFERLPSGGLDAKSEWEEPYYSKVRGWAQAWDDLESMRIYANDDEQYEVTDNEREPEEWNYETYYLMRSIRFGKFFYSIPDYSIYSHFKNLEKYEVDPENKDHYVIDDVLYATDKNELFSFPQKKSLPKDYRWPEEMTGIRGYSICRVGDLEELHFGPNMKNISCKSIICNDRLKKITFDGNLRHARRGFYECSWWAPIKKNSRLRTVDLSACDEIDIHYFDRNPLLVNVVLSDKIRVLDNEALLSARPMILRLPNIKKIGPSALGAPQIIELGETAPESINAKWLDAALYETALPLDPMSRPAITVISHSTKPPHIDVKGLTASGPYSGYTVYVPASAVETYRKDPYWGTYWKVEPISDKVLTVISEPSLMIEEGNEHEFEYALFNMGKADIPDIVKTKWESGNTKFATIDDKGRLTAKTPGAVTITLTLTDSKGNSYTQKSYVTILKEGTFEDWAGVEEIAEPEIPILPEGVYNLNGIRLGDSTEGLTPGLYIVSKGNKVEKTVIR